jgi:hypothetical protein
MAMVNRLWGAPRIHGELLTLGITVSERTMSRYLPHRLTGPSQSWWTFLANHLGNVAFEDDVIVRGEPCASNQWAITALVVAALDRMPLSHVTAAQPEPTVTEPSPEITYTGENEMNTVCDLGPSSIS